jgi:hypothetical protein
VVWEGWRRETSPYPDQSPFEPAISSKFDFHRSSI